VYSSASEIVSGATARDAGYTEVFLLGVVAVAFVKKKIFRNREAEMTAESRCVRILGIFAGARLGLILLLDPNVYHSGQVKRRRAYINTVGLQYMLMTAVKLPVYEAVRIYLPRKSAHILYGQ